MKQMIDLIQKATAGDPGFGAGGKGGGKGDGEWGNPSVILNRKYFQLVDKFDGNPAKFLSWIFDLITALESVDLELAKDLKELLKARPKSKQRMEYLFFQGKC